MKSLWIGAASALLMLSPALAQAQVGPLVDRSQELAWQNQQQLALEQLKPSAGWQVVEGGLRWRRVKGNGQGQHPTLNDVVKLNYAGRLVDGTEFDSTHGEPATFELAGLIPAWQIAVPLMGVGDTIEIATPSSLAYGPDGAGPIPGGATLFFKIELIAIPVR